MQATHAVAPSVRHVEVEGLRVVLDLATESYRILDDAASALWPVLIGERDAAASYDALTREFDVSEERWRSDLADFARRCEDQGLLVQAGSAPVAQDDRPAPRPPRGGPATRRALACLLATRRALHRHGFRTTYEDYARVELGRASAPLQRSLAAFTRAENLFVSGRAPGDCLLRSLSLYRFLRSAGHPAEHVIGVRRHAFAAHAWVECEGAPRLDERAPEFTPIARMGLPAAGPG
ncbi:MAG TPA: lasso peptide biosynthesis B2 protein [Thermoleophilaceae bacterium]|jgi:hypothetical protein